jgi:hypothetical protein
MDMAGKITLDASKLLTNEAAAARNFDYSEATRFRQGAQV